MAQGECDIIHTPSASNARLMMSKLLPRLFQRKNILAKQVANSVAMTEFVDGPQSRLRAAPADNQPLPLTVGETFDDQSLIGNLGPLPVGGSPKATLWAAYELGHRRIRNERTVARDRLTASGRCISSWPGVAGNVDDPSEATIPDRWRNRSPSARSEFATEVP